MCTYVCIKYSSCSLDVEDVCKRHASIVIMIKPYVIACPTETQGVCRRISQLEGHLKADTVTPLSERGFVSSTLCTSVSPVRRCFV